MNFSRFDDIRPYYDDEIHDAMVRIAHSESFPLLASYVFPDVPIRTVRKRLCSYRTVREFQTDTMKLMNERVIENSISKFSCDGVEHVCNDVPCLFVSNHRDIMLDSSLLQYVLVMNGLDTTEITFGENLMMSPLIIDIGRANRMFRVDRPKNNMRDFYDRALHLSEYIRHVISEKRRSVWIAQRNGRTKDGIDRTDQGIIKMFCMSCQDNRVKALDDLHIVPVAVSYEWEPCDILKALEVFKSQFAEYTKKPGEDLHSILTGLLDFKGEVHMEICKPIGMAELCACGHLTDNNFHRSVAKLIDTRINAAYRLFPNNYIAHDLLYGCSQYEDRYNDVQKNNFILRMKKLEGLDSCNLELLRNIFLGIYSNPVDNR